MKTTALVPALLFFFSRSSILTAAQQSDTAPLAEQREEIKRALAHLSLTVEQSQTDGALGSESSFSSVAKLMTGFLEGLEANQAETIARMEAHQDELGNKHQAELEARLELAKQQQILMLEAQQAKLEGAFNEIIRSGIITDLNHANQLHNWLDEDGSDGDFDLLYRASKDGFNSNAFHSKCDNKGAMLILIETTSGPVVGGYTNTAWSRSDKYEKANKSFIFALSGSSLTHPIRMKLKNENDKFAVKHHSSRGPIFGRGWRDLYVNKSMRGVRSKSRGTYQDNVSWPLESGKFYNIKEVEVYQVKTIEKAIKKWEREHPGETFQ